MLRIVDCFDVIRCSLFLISDFFTSLGMGDKGIDIRFHAFLVAVDNLPVQALFSGHVVGGIGRLQPVRWA